MTAPGTVKTSKDSTAAPVSTEGERFKCSYFIKWISIATCATGIRKGSKMSGYRFPAINILKIAVGKTSLCLSGCLAVCLSVHLSVCLCDCRSVCLSVGRSVCPSVRLCVCLSVCRSGCLSVCFFFFPFI